MTEPISYGWKCPCCGRVYNPRQEMCLYCGPNVYCGPKEKPLTINNLGDWISTNPCIVDTKKGPSNIPETNSAPGSPFYTTTTGIIGYEGPVQEVLLDAKKDCTAYVDGMCLGTKEPFKSDCQGLRNKCTEYRIENSVKEKLNETTVRASTK